MLMHEYHEYHAKVYFFLLHRNQRSIPCLMTVRNAQASQTNWTLVLKRAWALNRLPSGSVPVTELNSDPMANLPIQHCSRCLAR